ncbi:MAG: UDP-N-acetylglucosamine 1-carboxyvinyltransferase [Candidatus Omnitrophica bacterium]|nr:UDP-N-acetylglucosamine 1-carboxyvinyltransferase [Candidatus Omnitrophota bacterium]
MDKLIIEGPTRLSGEVRVDGSKNAALPIMAACILSNEKSLIKGVPQLSDVFTMCKILRALGVKTNFCDGVLEIDPAGYKGNTAAYSYVSTMRASICILGALLAKQKYAKVSLPGGCVIGPRPINIHIKGLRALGADITIEHGYVIAQTKGLRGSPVYLGGSFGSSVLATANVMMAATLAKGRTIIEYAACEPEIVDLANFLIKMGARIKGHNTHTIEIEGVKCLRGAEHTVIPDRIEAGTYMIASCASRGDIIIKGANIGHLRALTDKLSEAGAVINAKANGDIRVRAQRRLKTIDVTALSYPGFPTDLQAQMMALMSVSKGIAIITEKIYPERFMHVGELNRMGAHILLEGESAIIHGVKCLSGAEVMASDLRASAALVIGGLVARGKTTISRIYHLDRGYGNMEKKLSSLGAKIMRVKA